MTGFAATHTGSLTPSSDPWTFVGTVTWQSDIDPAILPDNEPVVLRLAFTTLSLTGATIAFTSSGSGRAATLPANGPFDGSTDYTVASRPTRCSWDGHGSPAVRDGFGDAHGSQRWHQREAVVRRQELAAV